MYMYDLMNKICDIELNHFNKPRKAIYLQVQVQAEMNGKKFLYSKKDFIELREELQTYLEVCNLNV